MGRIADWRQQRAEKSAAARAEAWHREGMRQLSARDRAQAEPAFREAVRLRTHVLGPDAVPTLQSRLGRAMALRGLQRFEDSEAEARAVIEAGARSPDSEQLVSKARLVLAHALKATGRAVEAQAEAATVRTSPPDHARSPAAQLHALGLITLGRHVEALAEQDAYLSTHPAEPIWTAKARSDRAQNLVYLGRFEEAEAESRALIELTSRGDGNHERWVGLASQNALVLALVGLGRAAEAESEARAAVDRARRAGVEPRFLLTLRLGLARSLSGQQRHDEALRVLLPAKKEFLGAATTEHELAAALHLAIGTAQLGLGEHQEAADSVQQALTVCRETLGPFHHRALMADTLHGRVLAAQGRLDEARERLTAASAAWREHFGAGHPEARAAEQALAELTGFSGRTAG